VGEMARWLFITVGVAVLLAATAIALGTAWLNTFIRSPAFRHEVETRAGQTLGGPVRVETIDLGFLGVKLRGVSTQVSRGNTFSARVENVECSYALGDLLRRRLTLTALTLDQPQIVLTRQPAAPASSPTSSTPSGPASLSPPEASQLHGASFQFVLESAKVRDGSFSLRDAAGAVVADLKGISAEADTGGYYEGKNISGTCRSVGPAGFEPATSSTPRKRPTKLSYGP
jgi:hypothetical protein